MKMNIFLVALTISIGGVFAEAMPLTFAEKTKIAKMTKAICDFEKFNDFRNVKQQVATFKVTACKKTVKDLGLVTSANCRVSGNPDGYVCSLMKLSDTSSVEQIDFVEKSSFFVYSKSKAKLDLIKKLAEKTSGDYIEFYVMVEKDKDLKTLFKHSWKDVIYSKSGETPAFWFIDMMPVERFELLSKPEVKVVTGRTLKAIQIEKNCNVRYKVKCNVELSTSFYGSFKGSDAKFYAVELSDETSSVYAYIQKEGKGRGVFDALSGVAHKRAEVEIRYKQNETNDAVFCLDAIEFDPD